MTSVSPLKPVDPASLPDYEKEDVSWLFLWMMILDQGVLAPQLAMQLSIICVWPLAPLCGNI